jgi:hypothetical protein
MVGGFAGLQNGVKAYQRVGPTEEVVAGGEVLRGLERAWREVANVYICEWGVLTDNSR